MWFHNQSESKWALADNYPSQTLLLPPNCLKLFLYHSAVFCTAHIQKHIGVIGSRKHFKLAMLFIPFLSSFSITVRLFYAKFPKISSSYKMQVWILDKRQSFLNKNLHHTQRTASIHVLPTEQGQAQEKMRHMFWKRST